MLMPDKYKNFSELSKSAMEHRDYCVRILDRDTDNLVIAIHGGGIEAGTSEVAEAIAGVDLSFYAFEGIKASGNGDLHITSHRFDEPKCLAIVNASSRVISIHGENSERRVVFLGGKDRNARKALRDSLTAHGFIVETSQNLQGLEEGNICNRSRNECGVQLELSYGLRRSFFKSLSKIGRRNRTKHFDIFVAAVRGASLD